MLIINYDCGLHVPRVLMSSYCETKCQSVHPATARDLSQKVYTSPLLFWRETTRNLSRAGSLAGPYACASLFSDDLSKRVNL